MTIRREVTFHAHDDTASVRLVQDNAQQIFDAVQEIRNNNLAREFAGLKPVLCIPELELMKLKRKYPDLASKDNEIRSKAWLRYLTSSESAPWRV